MARDKDGSLWFYLGKPFRGDAEFYSDSNKGIFCLCNYNLEYYGLKYEDFDFLK